jgi:hypothetical protein
MSAKDTWTRTHLGVFSAITSHTFDQLSHRREHVAVLGFEAGFVEQFDEFICRAEGIDGLV